MGRCYDLSGQVMPSQVKVMVMVLLKKCEGASQRANLPHGRKGSYISFLQSGLVFWFGLVLVNGCFVL